MKEKYVKIFLKVWCIDADWLVDKGEELGLRIAAGKKTRANMILSNTYVAAYGPKDKIDALCDWIKKNDYDVDIELYEEYEWD